MIAQTVGGAQFDDRAQSPPAIQGGYPWRGDRLANGVPTPITYYEGSMLRVEWTNQVTASVGGR